MSYDIFIWSIIALCYYFLRLKLSFKRNNFFSTSDGVSDILTSQSITISYQWSHEMIKFFDGMHSFKYVQNYIHRCLFEKFLHLFLSLFRIEGNDLYVSTTFYLLIFISSWMYTTYNKIKLELFNMTLKILLFSCFFPFCTFYIFIFHILYSNFYLCDSSDKILKKCLNTDASMSD